MTAEEAMQWFLEHPEAFEKCLLCSRPPTYIGMFAPDNSVKFGGIPGKQRLYGYAICDDCKSEPDCQAHVERVIFKNRHVI